MRLYRCAQSCNGLECMGVAIDGCCLYRRHTDRCGIHRRDDDAVKDDITTEKVERCKGPLQAQCREKDLSKYKGKTQNRNTHFVDVEVCERDVRVDGCRQ